MLICPLIMLTVWWGLAVYLVINSRKIGFLRDVKPAQDEPSLAIIVAVRNEEADLEHALSSVCNINYTNYKVIVVNDRSTDRTPQILEKLAAQYPQIITETITELPPRWLGKNHALYRGYLQTHAEWLLFTDADIVFEKDAIKKALTYATANHIHHLALMPNVISRSAMLNSILQTFGIMFNLKIRPWEARDPKSKAAVGVGAFNMVRRQAYKQAGTHEAIRLRPDDDLKLGAIVKQAGFRSDVLYGTGEISLEWYTSVGQFVNGLMKNVFSVSKYNLPLALFNGVSAFVGFCLPVPLGLLSGSVYGVLISLGILLSHWFLFWFTPGRKKWWYFLTLTYAGAVMVYIIIKSALLNVKDKGIYWRDSFYPLEELKKG
ncbi:glycosyltransferase [Mucilaginibacter mali]|uniref:Glycosyltransferase n=1 Tax=Mucilaginibacter mali TaxID=2740462 RepID=A0A7D4U8Y0_9SPHI|nr:glycosyltransferase family 2 protein [Mucilaginibacter mali]QKJ28578.1 glycosyltransferase [Mucilaginibacter mali]